MKKRLIEFFPELMAASASKKPRIVKEEWKNEAAPLSASNGPIKSSGQIKSLEKFFTAYAERGGSSNAQRGPKAKMARAAANVCRQMKAVILARPSLQQQLIDLVKELEAEVMGETADDGFTPASDNAPTRNQRSVLKRANKPVRARANPEVGN